MKFIIYRASAGSGKTYTLVREYLKMALQDANPFRFKNILAITFTNKAAAEMKERVLLMLHKFSMPENSLSASEKNMFSELKKALSLDENSLRERSSKTLSAILHHYGDFSVGTIDSFMHRVVRTFAHELKIPMNFSVELNNDVLIQTAVAEVLEKVGSDPEITRALVGFTLSRTDEEKKMSVEGDLCETAYDLLKEQTIAKIKKLRDLSVGDFLEIRKSLQENCKKYEDNLKELGANALRILNEEGLNQKDFYYGDKGIAAFYFKLKNYYPGTVLEPNSYVLKTLSENKWTGSVKSPDIHHKISARTNELKIIAETAIQKINTHGRNYLTEYLIKESIYTLATLHEINKVIDTIREEEGIVHISEFNQRVAEIVFSEPTPFIYERLGEKYQHFLIDEFQDTSILQWQNMLPLIENGLSQQSSSMIVGDGKQAIYRFRGGEVEQFSKLPDPFPENMHPVNKARYNLLQQLYFDPPDKLDVNYRSKKTIVDFNNDLYEFLSENILSEKHRSIYEGLKQKTFNMDSDGYVQVNFLPSSIKNKEREILHAEHTISIIEDLINNRKYQYRDIAVLTRKKKQGANIASALLNKGIPVISSESLMVESAPEIGFIISWLYLLNHENIQVNILSITNYLIQQGHLPFLNLNDFFEKNGSEVDEMKMLSLLSSSGYQINTNRLRSLSILEICNLICHTFQLNIQQNPYLQFFLEAIWSRSNHSASDIAVFMEWWEENRSKLSISMPEDANAVRLMTVHKSKGLQFPVVIMPYAHSEKSKTSSDWVENSEDYAGILPATRIPIRKSLESTAFADVLLHEERKRTLDAINLLYVATTRPEDALYIITGHSGPQQNLVKNGWEEYLELFAIHITPDKAPEGIFEWGNARFVNMNECEPTTNQGFSYKPYDSGAWQKRIQFSKKAPLYWDVEDDSESLSDGNLVHAILSKINTPADVEPAVQHFFENGTIDSEKKNGLSKLIAQIMEHPKLSGFFTPGLSFMNERELMLSNGKIIRPDRVIKKENKLIVIDYKTGKTSPEHIEQVKLYIREIPKTDSETAEGLVVYLHENISIVPVSA